MKSRIIAVHASQGENYKTPIVHEPESGRVWFIGDFDVDCDGSGPNTYNDPYFQADTTLHHNGKAINADRVPGIVVPPVIIKGVHGVVMGCKARATNLRNGRMIDCVVFDQGPTKKIGEGSTELARRLYINPNPNTGGEDEPVILYELWPGVPAIVDGVEYKLQPA